MSLVDQRSRYEPDWKLLLEYFKALLTWPPLAFVGLACFTAVFRHEFGIFLTNVRPKGAVFDTMPLEQTVPTSPPPDPDADPTTDPAVEPPGPPGGGSAEEVEQGAPEEGPPETATEAEPTTFNETAATAADDRYNELANRKLEDQFRYLNSLLVLSTQSVLDTIVLRGAIGISDYNLMYPEMTPENKSNILTVLYQQGLISISDGLIVSTEKGRRYAQWPERVAWTNAQLSVWQSAQPNPLAAFARDHITPPTANLMTGNLFANTTAPTPGSVAPMAGGIFGGAARRARRETATRTAANPFASPPPPPRPPGKE